MSPLNCSGGYMTVFFVIRLSNSRPNTVHQFFMVFLAIMESAVCLPERVGFLACGYEVSFRGKSGNDNPNLTASRKIARWSTGHINTSPSYHLNCCPSIFIIGWFWFNDNQWNICFNRLSFLAGYVDDCPINGSLNLILHFHCFKDKNDLTFFDDVTFLDLNGYNLSWNAG